MGGVKGRGGGCVRTDDRVSLTNVTSEMRLEMMELSCGWRAACIMHYYEFEKTAIFSN